MKENYYITTTLPYVNAKPHIGFALEIVSADVLARANKLLGKEVLFNTGTDEHGLKILRKAKELGMTAQEHANRESKNFKKLKELLNINFDNFIRTTDPKHKEAAQKFWEICGKKGFIYKKNYKINYCVGCELEKTESELVEGRCPDHPNSEVEIIEEENYFFKFSAFQKQLLKMYKENPDFVKPQKRFREIISFVEQGLQDFSISRLKEKMPWGVEVPNDDKHIMYVWFDALVNYISTLGWPEDEENFKKWWPAVQFCGKDNLRQQTAMWQAMLMAAELPCSEKVYVNGFINIDGQKMSKSLGNVISPEELVEKYGVDGTRYLLLSMGTFGEDSDINWGRLDEKFNADLANGIGNLTSRVITLYKKAEFELDFTKSARTPFENNEELETSLNEGRLGDELIRIMKLVKELDKMIEQQKPWELIKNDSEGFRESIEGLARGVYFVGLKLQPFMPETSDRILASLENKKKINLFPRLEIK
jgi:methionyl-tRNA synthetase